MANDKPYVPFSDREYATKYRQPYEWAGTRNGDKLGVFVSRDLKDGSVVSEIEFDRKNNDPTFATANVSALDLIKMSLAGQDVRTKIEKRSGNFQSPNIGGYLGKIKSPDKYVGDPLPRSWNNIWKTKREQFDLGHLLGNRYTDIYGFTDQNEIPMQSDLNREGSYRKAEELMWLFTRNIDNKKDVKFTVLPDYRGMESVSAIEGEDVTVRNKPDHFLVQIKGPHGSNTFYMPNTSEAMQEPSRYMVNKKWVQANMPNKFIEDNMVDEPGYRSQMETYLRNIAGNLTKTMPLKDAVRQTYMQSPIFRKQIEESKK